jgi:DNA modification methylase
MLLVGDVRTRLAPVASNSIHCAVTSPPYFGLRDYGCAEQIGLEPTPDAYVAELVAVFREVRRVLRDDGTLWLNLGDSIYSGNGQPKGEDTKSPARNFSRTTYRWLDKPGMGLPKKSLMGMPWRVAHALQNDGWTVRSEIIWHRVGSFTQAGVYDRPYTKHETIFLLSKSRRYHFDEACRELGSVWSIPHERALRGHSAAYPAEIPRRCILAGCPAGGTVLDPFFGAGTTGLVAAELGRSCIGVELNPAYATIAMQRLGLRVLTPSGDIIGRVAA